MLWHLVYDFKCGGCNANYYGKMKCHFKVRIECANTSEFLLLLEKELKGMTILP